MITSTELPAARMIPRKIVSDVSQTYLIGLGESSDTGEVDSFKEPSGAEAADLDPFFVPIAIQTSLLY
jgi:hypothetical protein